MTVEQCELNAKSILFQETVPIPTIPGGLSSQELERRLEIIDPARWNLGMIRFKRFYTDSRLGLRIRSFPWENPPPEMTLIQLRMLFDGLKSTYYPLRNSQNWSNDFSLARKVLGLGKLIRQGSNKIPSLYQFTPQEGLQLAVGFLGKLGPTDFDTN